MRVARVLQAAAWPELREGRAGLGSVRTCFSPAYSVDLRAWQAAHLTALRLAAGAQLAGRACARDGALRSAMTVAGVALQGVGGCHGARAGAATRGRLRRVRRTSCSAAPCQLRCQPRLAIAFSARAVWLLTRTVWLRMASTRLTGTGVHTLGVARPGRSTARAGLNCATAAIARRPSGAGTDGSAQRTLPSGLLFGAPRAHAHGAGVDTCTQVHGWHYWTQEPAPRHQWHHMGNPESQR